MEGGGASGVPGHQGEAQGPCEAGKEGTCILVRNADGSSHVCGKEGGQTQPQARGAHVPALQDGASLGQDAASLVQVQGQWSLQAKAGEGKDGSDARHATGNGVQQLKGHLLGDSGAPGEQALDPTAHPRQPQPPQAHKQSGAGDKQQHPQNGADLQGDSLPGSHGSKGGVGKPKAPTAQRLATAQTQQQQQYHQQLLQQQAQWQNFVAAAAAARMQGAAAALGYGRGQLPGFPTPQLPPFTPGAPLGAPPSGTPLHPRALATGFPVVPALPNFGSGAFPQMGFSPMGLAGPFGSCSFVLGLVPSGGAGAHHRPARGAAGASAGAGAGTGAATDAGAGQQQHTQKGVQVPPGVDGIAHGAAEGQAGLAEGSGGKVRARKTPQKAKRGAQGGANATGEDQGNHTGVPGTPESGAPGGANPHARDLFPRLSVATGDATGAPQDGGIAPGMAGHVSGPAGLDDTMGDSETCSSGSSGDDSPATPAGTPLGRRMSGGGGRRDSSGAHTLEAGDGTTPSSSGPSPMSTQGHPGQPTEAEKAPPSPSAGAGAGQGEGGRGGGGGGGVTEEGAAGGGQILLHQGLPSVLRDDTLARKLAALVGEEYAPPPPPPPVPQQALPGTPSSPLPSASSPRDALGMPELDQGQGVGGERRAGAERPLDDGGSGQGANSTGERNGVEEDEDRGPGAGAGTGAGRSRGSGASGGLTPGRAREGVEVGVDARAEGEDLDELRRPRGARAGGDKAQTPVKGGGDGGGAGQAGREEGEGEGEDRERGSGEGNPRGTPGGASAIPRLSTKIGENLRTELLAFAEAVATHDQVSHSKPFSALGRTASSCAVPRWRARGQWTAMTR